MCEYMISLVSKWWLLSTSHVDNYYMEQVVNRILKVILQLAPRKRVHYKQH